MDSVRVQRQRFVYSGGSVPADVYTGKWSLPPGVRFDATYSTFAGSPLQSGTFSSMVRVQDSYFPPETLLVPIIIRVAPPPLSIGDSLPSNAPLDLPFEAKVIAGGGTPPYSFQLGTPLPHGLSLDMSTGAISGTPDVQGNYHFNVDVTDWLPLLRLQLEAMPWECTPRVLATTASPPPPQLATGSSMPPSVPTSTRPAQRPSPAIWTTIVCGPQGGLRSMWKPTPSGSISTIPWILCLNWWTQTTSG